MKEPPSREWRFVSQGASHVLIPPGISKADRSQIAVSAPANVKTRVCPPTVKVKRNRVLIPIDGTSFAARPQGWLTAWTSDLVVERCIPPGEATTLATHVTESLALDPAVAFRVLYPDELVPPQRIQVVSPVLRDQAKAEEPLIIESEGASTGLNLTLRTSDNFIGFETALYSIDPRQDGIGYTVRALYADRNIGGKVERVEHPSTNYLTFPAGARYYRSFVKSGEPAFTALVVAAATRADLSRAIDALNHGTGTCADIAAGYCVAIPKRVALNAVIPIAMNGADVMVRWGADLAEALRTAGVRQPETVLAGLSIERSYKDRPTPISFNPADSAVLTLPLTGTESIRWIPQ